MTDEMTDDTTEAMTSGITGTPAAADIAHAWQRELPEARTESIEVITPIWRLAKLLADDRRRTLNTLGVDSSTLDLLSTLRRAGPPYELTTREITARTLITAGAVSQRIARAEASGLVVRSASSAHSRAVNVRLTDQGHEVIAATVLDLLAHEAELVAGLTVGQRVALREILGVLEVALVGHAETPSPPGAGRSSP